MDKDIYGNYLDSGTIFMDYRDNFGPDKANSRRILCFTVIICSMAQNLLRFIITGRTILFYDDNPIIEFSSNYNDYKYTIFGYFIIKVEATAKALTVLSLHTGIWKTWTKRSLTNMLKLSVTDQLFS